METFGFSYGISHIIEKEHATMRSRIAMNQGANITVFGKKYPLFADSLRQQNFIAGIDRTFGHIDHVMTRSA